MSTTEASTDLLTFHHTGLLVDSIEDSIAHLSQVFGKENISTPVFVSSQKVKVCFVKNGTGSFIELVEPVGEESAVYKLLKKRLSYYHLAYHVKDIHAAIKRLEGLHYKALELFNSEAFNGRLCVFLFTPEGHLIELIEL